MRVKHSGMLILGSHATINPPIDLIRSLEGLGAIPIGYAQRTLSIAS